MKKIIIKKLCMTSLVLLVFALLSTQAYALTEIEAKRIIENNVTGISMIMMNETYKQFPHNLYNTTLVNTTMGGGIKIEKQKLWFFQVSATYSLWKYGQLTDFGRISRDVYLDDMTGVILSDLSKILGGSIIWDCSDKQTTYCDGIFLSHTGVFNSTAEFRSAVRALPYIKERGTEPGLYYYVSPDKLRELASILWISQIEPNSIGGLAAFGLPKILPGPDWLPWALGISIVVVIVAIVIIIKKRKRTGVQMQPVAPAPAEVSG